MEISGEKKWQQRTLEHILRVFAVLVLKKYHPIIVGVTGSVGKSSTKEAIALVLSEGYVVRRSEGNYNNEFGVPLSILGEKSPGSSLFG
jgi:UDP-N-acetylmuramoyl-tripeptide--D-alanyl-D-alanine ligase